jgi:hypothetical protein
VERRLSREREEAQLALDKAKQELLQEREAALSAAADVAVVERYRDMIGSLQQDVQLAQAKNVDLLRQMHQVRLDNEKALASLADVHSMETRMAFNTLRQVEDRNVHAFSALKQSQKATDLTLASLGREHEDDHVFLSEMEALLKSIEVLKQRAEEAERRDLETSDELQGALLEIERLREVEADSMTRLSEGCDNIFRMEDELSKVERAVACKAEQAEELIEALQKMQSQNTELENKYESSLEANAYLAEQNNALKHAVLGLEGKLSELNAEIQLLRQRAHQFESAHIQQQMLLRDAQSNASEAAMVAADLGRERDTSAQTLSMLQQHLKKEKEKLENEQRKCMSAERDVKDLQASIKRLKEDKDAMKDTVEALQLETSEMTQKCAEAQKRCVMLERDLKISLQETQAQSTALNKLTTHVLHMQV